MINKENYKLHIIDHLEGKLNPQEEKELLCFLEQDTALKEEFELLSNTAREENVKETYFDKSFLKKKEQVNVSDYTDKLIALLENDLSKKERAFLLHEISV